MVKVAGKDRVELALQMAEYQWGRLPEVEGEIDRWDIAEQSEFLEEWPLEEERLRRLGEYVEEDLMDSEQLERYGRLKMLVKKNRPIIERLLKS